MPFIYLAPFRHICTIPTTRDTGLSLLPGDCWQCEKCEELYIYTVVGWIRYGKFTK